MIWEMEIEEVEAVLEKIWDLHDKLSDAIHSISRAHFLTSVKSLRCSSDFFLHRAADVKKKLFLDSDDALQNGFVYVKDFPIEEDDESAVQEAKSLNAIRTALENLEGQLEFFHTVQIQQRAERDAAIAGLEQSRIVLALRLAEHQGKKYKVIEEARAFVGEVHDLNQFSSIEKHFGSLEPPPTGKNHNPHEVKRSNVLVKSLISSFTLAKKWLKMDGIFGNAALVAVTMIALLHLQQATHKDRYILDVRQRREDNISKKMNVTKVFQPESSSSSRGHSADLDVLLARG